MRLQGKGRKWILAIAAAGFLAAVYEIWFIFIWAPSAPIRLDVLLLSLVLVCLYGVAVFILLSANRRKAAAILAVAVVSIGGVMAYGYFESTSRMKRAKAHYHARNTLLFEAKFRDSRTYQSYFGPFGATPDGYPSGHWTALEKDAYLRRLIINSKGRVWLFVACGKPNAPMSRQSRAWGKYQINPDNGGPPWRDAPAARRS